MSSPVDSSQQQQEAPSVEGAPGDEASPNVQKPRRRIRGKQSVVTEELPESTWRPSLPASSSTRAAFSHTPDPVRRDQDRADGQVPRSTSETPAGSKRDQSELLHEGSGEPARALSLSRIRPKTSAEWDEGSHKKSLRTSSQTPPPAPGPQGPADGHLGDDMEGPARDGARICE